MAGSATELIYQLRIALAKLEMALSAVSDSVASTDSDGRIQWCNAAFERLLGRRRIDLLGARLADLVPLPPERPAAAGGPGGPEEKRVVELQRDGERRVLEVSMARFQVRPQETGTVVVALDVTERAREEELLREAYARLDAANAELTRSNAELEQFAYIVSHDLQEPLRMVASFTELLSKRYRGKLDADADEFIAYAQGGAVRMQRLLNDLLAYSRVTTRQKSPEPTFAGEALTGALANLWVAIEQASAVVTWDPLPKVSADRSQLVQLFQNLVENALKFRRAEPPHVHVSARRDGEECLFSVRDDGIGFEPKHAGRIFRVFQRLHTEREYPGNGIGLAICKRIVERHKGRIWAESTPGEGSTFFFTVPATEDLPS